MGCAVCAGCVGRAREGWNLLHHSWEKTGTLQKKKNLLSAGGKIKPPSRQKWWFIWEKGWWSCGSSATPVHVPPKWSRISVFLQCSPDSESLKEWNCVTVETKFPPAHTMPITHHPSPITHLAACWHDCDSSSCLISLFIYLFHGWHEETGSFFWEHGKQSWSLTAVGNGKAVRHLQIVNVRRQSEFRGAELNHSYPKRAVLLIRAPWKQTPWNRQQRAISYCTFDSILRRCFTVDTYQSARWASLRARIPIKPAGGKRINSPSSPCPQIRCPHPPEVVWYSSFSPGRLDPTHIGDDRSRGEKIFKMTINSNDDN